MEPGLPFKLATMLTLLDDAGCGLDDLRHPQRRPGDGGVSAKNIRDSHRGDHTRSTSSGAPWLSSSNVYHLQGDSGPLRKLLQETGIQRFPRTAFARPPGWNAWRKRKLRSLRLESPRPARVMLVKMAYGYCVRGWPSPIQMDMFYNAIARTAADDLPGAGARTAPRRTGSRRSSKAGRFPLVGSPRGRLCREVQPACRRSARRVRPVLSADTTRAGG